MASSYPIKIWSGLLLDGHTQKIENALWEFIWLVNKVTKEEEGIGYVLKGAPVKIDDIRKDLKRSYPAVYRHLQQLKKHGYINMKKAPYGMIITINNSKKFTKNDKAGLIKNDKAETESFIKNENSFIKYENGLIKNDKANKILKDNKYINKGNVEHYSEIINYLNEKADTKYKTTTEKTIDLIRARLNEGFTIEDFKTVIDKKIKGWTGTEWEKFIRPVTLFGTKFESYLNEKITKKDKDNDYFRA